MASSLLPIMIPIVILLSTSNHATASNPVPACPNTCGSIPIKYPLSTAYGCGSPRFYPYTTCKSNQLILNTHTGSYPITSVSYTTKTLTITPPYMSTCTAMHASSNFGLDWASPFQLGPSTFILINCKINIKGPPLCDLNSDHLCAVLYTCPAVQQLGLPLLPPTDTCCVYSPANLDSKGELDLKALNCEGFVSVVGLGDDPTNPYRWTYGVAVKYTYGAFDEFYVLNRCSACEDSGGVCGYLPPGNDFDCVCNNGVNSTTDCYGFKQLQSGAFQESSCLRNRKTWLGILAWLIVFIIAA